MSEAVIVALIAAAATVAAAVINSRRNQAAHAGVAQPDPSVATPRATEQPRQDAGGPVVPHDPALSNRRQSDRNEFLTAVRENEGADAADNYARVIDDLIAWGDSLPELQFRPKPPAKAGKKQQHTVTFCLRSSGGIFWQAYPAESKRYAAKLHIEMAPGAARESLRCELGLLSASGQPDSSTVPTIRFPDVVSGANRERVKRLLEDVLRRSAPGR